MAKGLKEKNLKHILIFSNGIYVNGSELVRGFHEVAGNKVQISGGLAGDGSNFKNTWVMDGEKPCEKCITAVGLYGDDIIVGCASKGGWDTFGPERTITKAKGNVLYEIDGEPALALYKKYLGERAQELPASALLFPLSIWSKDNHEEKVVRTILSVDEAAQSMTFAGDILEGWKAQLMRANLDRFIDGASKAGKLAQIKIPGKSDILVLAISCVGRRLVLGERSEEEVEITLNNFPKGAKQIGFYSYGEISPNGFEKCSLHNQTMTLTSFSEK